MNSCLSPLKMASNDLSMPSQPPQPLNTKMQQQVNTINFKLNQRVAKLTSTKQRNEETYKPRPLMIKMSREDAQTFIENDVETYHKQKLSWKRMDRTSQWKYVTDYIRQRLNSIISDADITIYIDQTKRRFLNNELQVEFDNVSETITKLNTMYTYGKPPKEIVL